MPFDRQGTGWRRLAATAEARALPLRLLRELLPDAEAEWDRIGLFLPAAFALGAATFFLVGGHGAFWPVLAGFLLSLVAALWWHRHAPALFCFLIAAALSGGYLHATSRTAIVAAPAIGKVVFPGAVTGVIEASDPRSDGSSRWTLRLIDAGDMDGEPAPNRISIVVPAPGKAMPGDRVSVRVILFPNSGPSRPGGYDPGFWSYFEGVGANGRALEEPLVLGQDEGLSLIDRMSAAIFSARLQIADRIAATLDNDLSGFAVALLTGLRRLLDTGIRDELRISGLGHILAISGLHMAIVAVGLFWTFRQVLAALPVVSIRLPVKAIAAAIALAGSTAFLLLSGAAVATQRAWVMIAIMFFAVLVGRPALTLRNVALAGWVVLLLRPETVMSASFQMSFAATIALIVGYRRLAGVPALRLADGAGGWQGMMTGRLGRFVIGLVLTAVLAGLATSPIAAHHFGRIAPYGILANVLAMPVVTLLIMPAGILALALMPFGLSAMPLHVMGAGLRIVADIAAFISGLPGSVGFVPQASAGALLAITVAAFGLAVMARPPRLLLLSLLAAGTGAWILRSGPVLLVNESASLVAARVDDEQMVFLRDRGSEFTKSDWLRADGDGRPVDDPTLRAGVSCDDLGCTVNGSDPSRKDGVVAVSNSPEGLVQDCGKAVLIVARYTVPQRLRTKCEQAADTRLTLIIDKDDLAKGGAHAVYRDAAGLPTFSRTVRKPGRHRPWQLRGSVTAADADTDQKPATRSKVQ